MKKSATAVVCIWGEKVWERFLFKNDLAPPVMNELDYYVQILIMDSFILLKSIHL